MPSLPDYPKADLRSLTLYEWLKEQVEATFLMTQRTSEITPGGLGDTFQENVANWLSRAVPDRAQNLYFDLSVMLATDIGLLRKENQDRVAALRLSARQTGQPIIAVVVADGMGGLRDGARCATLAVSSFFQALVRHRHQGLEDRAAAAAAHANDTVYAFAGGRGGATLSALLFDAGTPPVIVNLGDSRIYACGTGVKVERLTVDDSLEEAVGGHGRDLLQFVGMGTGMKPHVRTIPPNVLQLALTTDGIHYIEAETLASVFYHAPDLKSASDRLLALARWCGGHDNASMALVDLRALPQALTRNEEGGIQVSDPFGTLTTNWIRDIVESQGKYAATLPAQPSITSNSVPPSSKHKAKKRPRRASEKAIASPVHPKDDIQLTIQIGKSTGAKAGDDSR